MDSNFCKNCTGCAVCFNSCPSNAISMKENSEGFLYPYIDDAKCINCHLCARMCPVLNYQKVKKENPTCYAVAASDEIRKKSSSGGVFSVLALHILEQGGGVVGASFKSDGSVWHVLIEDSAELIKLQGSKYLQSDISNVYKPVKKFLDSGRKLLFTGTPCQIAGIKSFLKRDYQNLYLLDIVCHGVPSPQVFKKYLLENFGKKTFVSTNFRDKKYGWSPELTITTTTTTTTTSFSAKIDDFMRAFLNNLCLRKSCGSCVFNSLPRQGDLTIGDFWGINQIDEKLNDGLGLSEVLVNTPRGGILLRECLAQFKIFEQTDFEKILPFNPTIYISGKHHGNRDNFFNAIKTKTLHEAVNENEKYDYLCLNFWTSLNYGAVLTAYAFQNILDNLGYKNAHIDYRYAHVIDKFNDSFTDKFARKYLHSTRQCFNYNDFNNLNNCVQRGFIVGSDQVFRDDYISHIFGIYLLAFVSPDKQRIAISASFGKDSFCLKNADKFFQAFDAISVREEDGVNILKKNGYMSAEHILDPVFLVDNEVFKALAKDADVPVGLVVGYVLDENEDIRSFTNVYGNEYINIAKLNLSVEEFVAYFVHAKAIITDSFHGTCFAIIFNKPFRCFYNKERGNSRFLSLFKSLELNSDCINKEPNWNFVNHLIGKERKKGLEWLTRSLERVKPKDKKMCDRLYKIAKKKQKHHHSFWWHLCHLKF